MDTNRNDKSVALSEDEARAGVTGHHVRYVLGFGLAGVIIAFAVLGVYFGYEGLTERISRTLSRDPVTLMRDVAPYLIVVGLGMIAGVLLLGLWSLAVGPAENASQLGMRIRVVTQFVVVCAIMAIVYLAVS